MLPPAGTTAQCAITAPSDGTAGELQAAKDTIMFNHRRAHVSWKTVQASDLFSFFNISETGSQSAGAGLTAVSVAPGGNQEFIDLAFDIDARAEVVGFRLGLDRHWLDDTRTGMTSGADLAASVARTLASADPVLAEVAEALMAGGFAASRSPVILRTGSEPRAAEQPDIAALVATFTIASAPPATVHGRRTIVAANRQRGPQLWFTAAWL
jgi:hypothetical protein